MYNIHTTHISTRASRDTFAQRPPRVSAASTHAHVTFNRSSVLPDASRATRRVPIDESTKHAQKVHTLSDDDVIHVHATSRTMRCVTLACAPARVVAKTTAIARRDVRVALKARAMMRASTVAVRAGGENDGERAAGEAGAMDKATTMPAASAAPAPAMQAAPAPEVNVNLNLTKKGKPMPKAQKPKRRKAKTGAPEPVKVAPTKAEVEAEEKFDAIVAEGGAIFEVFIRARGPNQWFPVGPMAVKNPRSIKSEIWAAEEPLKRAGFRMYPKLLAFPANGKVEYGYRERDESKKMTEEEIRAGGGTKNPFEDVILLTKDDGVSTSTDEGSLIDKFKKMLNPYD